MRKLNIILLIVTIAILIALQISPVETTLGIILVTKNAVITFIDNYKIAIIATVVTLVVSFFSFIGLGLFGIIKAGENNLLPKHKKT